MCLGNGALPSQQFGAGIHILFRSLKNYLIFIVLLLYPVFIVNPKEQNGLVKIRIKLKFILTVN